MKAQQIEDQIKESKSVMLYFFKNSCSSCQVLKPKVEQLLIDSFPKMKLIFIDSSLHPEFSASFIVFSNPTMILFFEGKEYKRYNQFVSMIELERYIQTYYSLVYEQ